VGVEAVRRHQTEAAAPNLVHAAPHKVLHSPTRRLRKILKVVYIGGKNSNSRGFYKVGRPCPFRRTLLKGPLARSKSNLDSTTYTIVEIKT